MSKPFPVRLLVLAVLAFAFGIGIAATVLISRSDTTQGTLSASPITSAQSIQPGKPAPEFTLNTLNGEPISLKSFRGKRVLVNFWASWCGPCKTEAPDLQSAYTQLQKNGDVAFIGIGLLDKTENLKAFVESNKLTYTIVEDTKGTTGDAYRAFYLPVTVFINTDGTIHKTTLGAVTKDDVLKTFGEMK